MYSIIPGPNQLVSCFKVLNFCAGFKFVEHKFVKHTTLIITGKVDILLKKFSSSYQWSERQSDVTPERQMSKGI